MCRVSAIRPKDIAWAAMTDASSANAEAGGTGTTRWWWVRHAPVSHLDGFIYGDSDPHADVTDVALFDSVARRLPESAVWIVTNLVRTRQTAEAIARAGYELPDLAVEPDLREQGFGRWHGRRHSERDAERSDAFVGIWNCAPDETPPGGESFVDLMHRVAVAVERITCRHEGRDIVCIAHGGTIRAALAHALELSPTMALAFGIDNVSLTRIERVHRSPAGAPSWRVRGVNM
jgi:broad specificity phosphatase PhoE